MANWCDVSVRFPLEDIPYKEQRKQLEALYKAEVAWSKAVEQDPELRIGTKHEEFIAQQPGVPTIEGEDTKYRPAISASWQKQDDTLWVHPYFELTVPLKEFPGTNTVTSMETTMNFKYTFPWWAQVGFAGAKKFCNDKNEVDEPGTYKFLFWEQPVAAVLKNLEYAMNVRENFPTSGELKQWLWISDGHARLYKVYEWLSGFNDFSKRAIATLDWSEVAWLMTLEDIWEDDEPNQYMAYEKEMEADTQKFNEGIISRTELTAKYARTEAFN